MTREYREPYKDAPDHTSDAEKACSKYIVEYLEQRGIVGYVLGPTKFTRPESKAAIVGIVILDPHKDHPEELMFFINPMKPLQFRPIEDELLAVKTENLSIVGKDREYEFTIDIADDERIPLLQGSFSYNSMTLKLD